MTNKYKIASILLAVTAVAAQVHPQWWVKPMPVWAYYLAWIMQMFS